MLSVIFPFSLYLSLSRPDLAYTSRLNRQRHCQVMEGVVATKLNLINEMTFDLSSLSLTGRMYFKVKPDSCLTWTLIEQSTDETGELLDWFVVSRKS